MAARKTVLIVDDDQDARFVLTAALNHDGYNVIEAPDGVAAVSEASRHRPDIIVMDIRMPQMDGLQASELLREDERTRGIPIVALSGETFEDDDVTARRIGTIFAVYVRKPVRPSALRETIRGIIGDP
jgi:two-component system, cell cycle response regulator DivK